MGNVSEKLGRNKTFRHLRTTHMNNLGIKSYPQRQQLKPVRRLPPVAEAPEKHESNFAEGKNTKRPLPQK